jgi:hypothetical protein
MVALVGTEQESGKGRESWTVPLNLGELMAQGVWKEVSQLIQRPKSHMRHSGARTSIETDG